jgi:hypothetical protein
MRTATYAGLWTVLAGTGAVAAAVVGLCATPADGLAPLGALVGLAAVAGALATRGTDTAASLGPVGRRMALCAAGTLAAVGLGHLGPPAIAAALLLLAGCPPVVSALSRLGDPSRVERPTT